MTVMLDLREAFITLGFDVSVRSLKMWLALIIALILFNLIGVLVLSMKNGIPMIFKSQNLDIIWTNIVNTLHIPFHD